MNNKKKIPLGMVAALSWAWKMVVRLTKDVRISLVRRCSFETSTTTRGPDSLSSSHADYADRVPVH
jgi:hypothetical protein